MKLLTPLAAIIATAAAGQVYTTQPAEAYANSAEIYQSVLEHQQQGLYSDQSHAVSGQSIGADQLHALSGQEHGDQLAYSGHSRQSGEKNARVLSYVSENNGHGYQYSYETDNGIKAQEDGQITGHKSGTEAHGAYSYKGDDGQVYTITYTAGQHGFQAQGAHIPTPPPLPEAIAKSLEQNAKDEAAGIFDDGQYTRHQVSHRQQQPIQHHQQAVQAIQYENAIQQDEFQPGHHLSGQQQSYQLEGHQLGGQQQSYQLGGHRLGRQQQSYQLEGHQSGVQQRHLQLGSHQSEGQQYQLAGHQSEGQQYQLGGHQSGGQQQSYQLDHQSRSYQGQQPSGFQLSGHQVQQLGGFQPSYPAINTEGYRKH